MIHLSILICSQPGVKYALRLKNQGGRTCNGDGGVSVLRCPDGTTFSFASCSLSFNGTNQIRGQIPHILYFRYDVTKIFCFVAEMFYGIFTRATGIQMTRTPSRRRSWSAKWRPGNALFSCADLFSKTSNMHRRQNSQVVTQRYSKCLT